MLAAPADARKQVPCELSSFYFLRVAAAYCDKIVGQFAERLCNQFLTKSVDIDFQPKLFFQVQDELYKVETLLNHLARFHFLDVIPWNVREIFREKFLHRL